MKVLWFSQVSANFKKKDDGYNGSGWVASLETELKRMKNIELSIAFLTNESSDKVEKNNTTYYAIQNPKMPLLKKLTYRIFDNYIEEEEYLWPIYRKKFLEVIKDNEPDVIQIFGSENKFGLIAGHTNVPIVLHIQGIMSPYLNAFLPPFVSWNSLNEFNANVFQWRRRNIQKQWLCYCHCEERTLKSVFHFIGRTDWDMRVTKIFNNSANYYYCGEILREPFYCEYKRQLPTKLTIVTTISTPLYKGFDLILKTADIMKNKMGMAFTWRVFGRIDPTIVEKLLSIKHEDVNVELEGVVTADEIKEAVQHCTVYMHPSYIDNSPNSVCEAQMLGCTVIATNVGGICSLFENEECGVLIPSNDPYQAAYIIQELYKDSDKNLRMGKFAREIALKRHNKKEITNDLLSVYESLLK